MKIALGYILKNEYEYLSQTLPIIKECFDGVVAIDTGSNDGTCDLLSNLDCDYFYYKWDNDFSNARNYLIEKAELMSYNALFVMDADECMFPDDIKEVLSLARNQDVISLPRYNLVESYNRYSIDHYPDYTFRCFHLNKGFRYKNKIHEQLFKVHEKLDPTDYVFDKHVYHYGWCKNKNELIIKELKYKISSNIVTDLNQVVDCLNIFNTPWNRKRLKQLNKRTPLG